MKNKTKPVKKAAKKIPVKKTVKVPEKTENPSIVQEPVNEPSPVLPTQTPGLEHC